MFKKSEHLLDQTQSVQIQYAENKTQQPQQMIMVSERAEEMITLG